MALFFCQLLPIPFIFFYFFEKEKDHLDTLKLKKLMIYWWVLPHQLSIPIAGKIFLSGRRRLINLRNPFSSLTRAGLIRETLIFIKRILLRILIRSVMTRALRAGPLILLKQVLPNVISFLVVCIISIWVLFVSMDHKATAICLNICYLIW